MVLIDGVVRLLPGALGHPESSEEESFENGILEYPQYTRPPEYRGMKVPDVLLSGNHAEIEQWRRQQALDQGPGGEAAYDGEAEEDQAE